ncbi:biopolymer transporter ExbD [Leptospira sp. 96542]|nr:biopolymer transporter ExbD [Leptospira sp. 96542]
MKIRRPKSTNNIEISSLIDVLFILLIFLMLAVRLDDVDSKIQLDLPESKTKDSGSRADQFSIVIKKDGGLFLNDVSIKREDLQRLIHDSRSETESVTVYVDKQSIFDLFVFVTDELKAKGYKRVNIVTVTKN